MKFFYQEVKYERNTEFRLTPIEWLVVIATIAVLIALLLSVAREAARQTQGSDNLKQLGHRLRNAM